MLTAVCPRTRQALPQRTDISTTEAGVGSDASETPQSVPRSSGELSPTASDKKIVLMTMEAFEQIVLMTMADCAGDDCEDHLYDNGQKALPLSDDSRARVISFKSWPAQNAGPVAESMITRTARSPAD